MTKIVWDPTGERLYETGTDRGVVYPMDENGTYLKGVAWNGLMGVSESPSGAEATPLYANNHKYLELRSVEEFGGTITAYTYPDEFADCDGSKELAPGVRAGQQKRKPFGLSYRTLIGNDVKDDEYGYKLHLVYGAIASPSEKEYNTINDSPEAVEFSWEFSTTPVSVDGFRPMAHIVIDSTKVAAEKLTSLENMLYGSASEEAKLPLPNEIAELFKNAE